jgi:putative PEP-CTERM system histidine kinase
MFCGGMLALCVEALCNAALVSAYPSYAAVDLAKDWLLSVSFLPGFWLLFSITYARGDAREVLRRWRMPLALAFILPISIATICREHLVKLVVSEQDASREVLKSGWSGSIISLFALVASVAILMNLERTFRASVGTMRWRIKFMLLGVGVIFVARLYSSSQALLFGAVDPSLAALDSAALLVATVLILRSLLRAGKFSLDVYPSQSVLQSSLTVLLAGIYLLIVGLSAKVVAYIGGDASFALKAFVVLVALVLLAVVLQSDRARLSLRRFVSRNFQRPLYDYRTVWRKFTEATASRVEQTELCRALVRLMAEVFQALSVSLWLFDTKSQAFVLGASTSVSEAKVRESGPSSEASAGVLSYCRDHPDPSDIELVDAPWAAALRLWHPTEFPKGGHRVCVPLMGRGELLGLVTLGDRVGGAVFSVQDFDMLKCVGDHTAANLFNVQLSQKLLQARELEAFQTMATFFVHDLKNAASTLKLMLQNLPVHFDDPEFRADALRGTAKTVNHIDHLIGRLGSLRHELKIERAETDLNEIVGDAIGTFDQESASRFAKELTPLPSIQVDRDQIFKVVTNLLLNAMEASPPGTRIRIATNRSDEWAVLSVSDNGCGMTTEFMNNSLFRPFKTTKKSGLGIGMFQSKLIVEAHGGRISATSVPSKGSTFEISLPVTKS